MLFRSRKTNKFAEDLAKGGCSQQEEFVFLDVFASVELLFLALKLLVYIMSGFLLLLCLFCLVTFIMKFPFNPKNKK